MSPSESVQRAIAMLEQQLADLSGIRNATARDPSFKNWRQATLTTLQRIWPGDQERSERFRRIPFSPADPRSDHRAVREQYSRGCQEAGRVLTGFLDEIRERGVPELSDEPLPLAPESDFEDGFPTLDLPVGDVPAPSDPARLAENLLAGLGDEPPQGKDPSFADPARLPVAAPAAPAAPAPPNGKKGPGMKARLRDLLGFAQLSAKSLAGFPRESSPVVPAVLQSDAVTPNTLGITPLGDDVGSVVGIVVGHVPATVSPSIAAATPATPAVETAPAVPARDMATHASAVAPGAPVVEAASDVPADWPLLPRRASAESLPPVAQSPWPATRPAVAAAEPATPAATVAAPDAAALPVAAMPVVAAPAPAAAAPASVAPVAEESNSVIMSRPTTLRGTIDKVSIESLISAEFRASADEPAASDAMSASTPVATPPAASEPVEPAPTAAEPSPPEAQPTPPPVSRPALTLVRPLLDDPEFNVDPTPSTKLPEPSADAPVSALAPKPSRTSAKRSAPKPAPPPVAARAADDDDFDDDGSEDATQGANVDPEEFARATDEFMRSSPVLGASPRRASRAQEPPDFGDPDAIAVASMAQDLTRMEVPKERHAEVRARLMDLARRLERGELEWSALRKAVWFAMEHPELARRLMPVLLPWIDRAA